MENLMVIKGIECYEKDGVAYLKLETVARGLGFTREKNGVEYVMWDRVNKYLSDFGFHTSVENGVPTFGHEDFIPENIFYRLAMKAKNATAENFQALVADEIIPSIRKTGSYSISPKDYPSALRALADEVEKRQALEAENEHQRQVIADYEPKVRYCDLILQSKESLAVTQIAADYGISAKKLNKILHEEGIQHKVGRQWVLYRDKMGLGYTKSETIPITRSNGDKDSVLYTKWTQSGRLLIHQILEKRGIYALMDMED